MAAPRAREKEEELVKFLYTPVAESNEKLSDERAKRTEFIDHSLKHRAEKTYKRVNRKYQKTHG